MQHSLRGHLCSGLLSAEGKPTGAADVMTDGQNHHAEHSAGTGQPGGMTLIGWRQQGQLRWQVYDAQNKPIGPCGSAAGASLQAAGVVDRSGRFVLFP
jgi:hypothetical protein